MYRVARIYNSEFLIINSKKARQNVECGEETKH